MHTGSGLANRSLVSDENSSILSSESASSTNEAKCVPLTPLHAKQLTASDLFKSNTPVGDKANYKASTISDEKLSTTTLSPLHVTGSGILKQSANDLQSPEKKPIAAGSGSQLAIGLSPVHTKLSSSQSRQLKVTEHSSPTHEQKDSDYSLLQLRDAEEDTRTKPDFPKAESSISSSVPEDHLGSMPDQSYQSIEQSVEVQSKSKQEGTTVASPMKSFLESDKSGLGEDLAELQSALQAAGLPPMAVKDEETPKEEPAQSFHSSRAVGVGTKDAKIPESSAPVDTKSKPLTNLTSYRDSSESGEQDPTKVSGKKDSPGAIRGFDLREAIRAIASEELTSISKEILKQQKHSVSKHEQPSQENREIASASSGKELERGTESLLPRGDGEASHDTYEGLEKLSDLLADIEHDSEAHKSTVKNEGSRKPGRSSTSARKLTSILPKTSTKASGSKEGPVSKVDARLSSKAKASDRASSAGKSSYRTSTRLAALAAPKKKNKTPSATSIVGSQAKPKHRPQTFRPGTSKSAPPKHPSSGRAGLKQYSGTAAKSTPQPSRSIQHQIVIPTGSSSALESQSDSEDEVIHAAHEGRKKMIDERPEVKMDAWKIALQEEKVCSFFIVPQYLNLRLEI